MWLADFINIYWYETVKVSVKVVLGSDTSEKLPEEICNKIYIFDIILNA